MFERQRHQQVLEILRAFDADVLEECGFLFGGGTRIVLDLDEYRQSDDIDFLCSNAGGYAELRSRAKRRGYPGLFTDRGSTRLAFPREMRIDQYGIRFPIAVGDEQIRVELIREARVELQSGIRPRWSPVSCLTFEDCALEKLLANSDRWADRQTLSRDLVDLAVLRRVVGEIPEPVWDRAEKAYRATARSDLVKALSFFGQNEQHRQRCFQGLQLSEPAPVLEGLELLRRDLELPDLHPE